MPTDPANFWLGLIAAVGLFAAGSMVSIWHGITTWGERGGADYLVNYVVLGLAFVLEGISFRQAVKQTRGEATRWGLRPATFLYRTSNPTLRAVFMEDAAALIGILLAAAGVFLHFFNVARRRGAMLQTGE